MRRMLLAACCALAALSAGPLPASAQTLRIALRQDLDTLDPTLATTYVGRIVFAGLCDKLLDINEKLEIVPQLATRWEWSDDKTLVLHLRPGVVFHDGEKLDAAAVKFTLEHYLTQPGSFRRAEISAIDHVEVVDLATVRIVLKAASGACCLVASSRVCVPLALMVKSATGSLTAQSCEGCAAQWMTASMSRPYRTKIALMAEASRISTAWWV